MTDRLAETGAIGGGDHVATGEAANVTSSAATVFPGHFKKFRHFVRPFLGLIRFFFLASYRRLICCVRTNLFLTRVRIRAEPRQKRD